MKSLVLLLFSELTQSFFVTQRSRAEVNFDSFKIFKTPRKLIQSLQDPCDLNSGCSEKQNRRFRSLSSGNIEWSPTSEDDQNGSSDNVNYDCKESESVYDDSDNDMQIQDGPESVVTDELPADADVQMPPELVPETESGNIQTVRMEKTLQKTKYKLLCGLSFALLAMATPLVWITSQDEGHYLVPT